MSQLRSMLRQRGSARQRVDDAVSCGRGAAAELRRQYRVSPLLPLGAAAVFGIVAGKADRQRIRLPPGVGMLAWRGLVSLWRGWS